MTASAKFASYEELSGISSGGFVSADDFGHNLPLPAIVPVAPIDILILAFRGGLAIVVMLIDDEERDRAACDEYD